MTNASNANAACYLYSNFVGTLSETTTANSTDPAKTNSSENEGMSKELKICLGVAALVTVVGVGLCLFIRLKAGNSYAMGGNVPKPLGGMPDDY